MKQESAPNLRRSHALELDMPMDEGIAPYVHILRGSGIETYESCEGGEGHIFPEPTIRFHGGRAAGFKALSIAIEHGLPIYGIRRLWTVDDGELTGPVWEIVFRNKARSEEA
jgi:hypothetical protein